VRVDDFFARFFLCGAGGKSGSISSCLASSKTKSSLFAVAGWKDISPTAQNLPLGGSGQRTIKRTSLAGMANPIQNDFGFARRFISVESPQQSGRGESKAAGDADKSVQHQVHLAIFDSQQLELAEAAPAGESNVGEALALPHVPDPSSQAFLKSNTIHSFQNHPASRRFSRLSSG
jgi:hypothetical protein